MGFSDKYSKAFRYVIPTPFSIALILTFLTLILAFIFQKPEEQNHVEYSKDLLLFWERGLWSDGGLIFTVQMMLMLVLGHVIAISKPINWLISKITNFCNSNASSAIITTFFTILVSLFNWGLGLIFGAILARKIGEHAQKNNININYPLIGACGYIGLMVWHGGISGNASLKIAEEGAIKNLIGDSNALQFLPENVSFNETIFSSTNLIVSIVLIIVLPLFAFLLSKLTFEKNAISLSIKQENPKENKTLIGAEKIDTSIWLAILSGGIILILAFILFADNNYSSSVIKPNFINLSLLGLALIFHKNITSFLSAIDEAISGSSGILIQFPLYFGILGIMKHSGLMTEISNFFIEHSTNASFNFLTLLSAGLVNIFVPSGGGQWAIQGPIIIEAVAAKGLDLGKSILALSYGDQLTNMLQPFWALPLLGITKLKATQILPYTLLFMVVGFVIFSLGLFFF